MTAQPLLKPVPTKFEMISQLYDGATLTFPNVTWEEYEELLEQLDDRPGIRLSYYHGNLTAMSVSPEHENRARFIEQLFAALRLRLRINIRSFGSWTMRKKKKKRK